MHLSVARPPQGRVGPSTGTVSLGIPPRSEMCIRTHHASGQLAEGRGRTQNIASFEHSVRDRCKTVGVSDSYCSIGAWLQHHATNGSLPLTW